MSALSRSILVTALACAGAFVLSACGQKGDLYLPAAKATPSDAAAPSPAPAASTPAVRP